MLVNWHVPVVDAVPEDRQAPDYRLRDGDYWFFRYFREKPEVDILDVAGAGLWDHIERRVLHVHLLQGIRAVCRMHRYDLVISHGMTSGIVVAAFRTLFRAPPKHLVFDIGCFNSAAESGLMMRILQRASRSISAVVYHAKCQGEYYRRFYPWIAERSRFIPYGADVEAFTPAEDGACDGSILCVGYVRRDWDTLVEAYAGLSTDRTLRIVGHVSEAYRGIPGVEQIPVVPVNELKAMIRAAGFCVLPLESMRYAYGQMTLLQQMAMEKCVITADVPSVEGYLEDGRTALLYRPGDAEDLRCRMAYALAHPDDVRRIGREARRFLLERCSERIMAQQTEDFIRSVMSR